MVIFDILQISDDAKRIIIKAHIPDTPLYDGYSISDIYINTDKNFLESGVNTTTYNYHKEFNSLREIKLIIEGNELLNLNDFTKHLFFISIKVKGAANSCSEYIPCELNKVWTTGITFDTRMLYNKALMYIKELGDTCNTPQGFTDFILHWEGFKILVESGHYIDAIKIYNSLFINKNTKSSTCNCHGKLSF